MPAYTVLLLPLVVASVVALLLARLVVRWVTLIRLSRSAGAPVGFLQLVSMHVWKVDSRAVVLAYVHARTAGLDVTLRQLESHHLAGGHVGDIVTAGDEAQAAGIALPWPTATAMDLAGQDVVHAVRRAVLDGATEVRFATRP